MSSSIFFNLRRTAGFLVFEYFLQEIPWARWTTPALEGMCDRALSQRVHSALVGFGRLGGQSAVGMLLAKMGLGAYGAFPACAVHETRPRPDILKMIGGSSLSFVSSKRRKRRKRLYRMQVNEFVDDVP